jgi:NADH-quinone oxidoreductase subunit J
MPFLFVGIATLGLLAALGTVLARNLVHAALFLIAYFFSVACVFVLLEAEFLAALQVLVYIGAVAILLMFGIMLTRNIQGDDTTTLPLEWKVPGIVVGLAVFVVLFFGINNKVGLVGEGDTRTAWQIDRRPAAPLLSDRGKAINDMGQAVGVELMTRYLLAFEVAGLLLTAALVGAIALAHREDDERPSPDRNGAVATNRVGAGEPSSPSVPSSPAPEASPAAAPTV